MTLDQPAAEVQDPDLDAPGFDVSLPYIVCRYLRPDAKAFSDARAKMTRAITERTMLTGTKRLDWSKTVPTGCENAYSCEPPALETRVALEKENCVPLLPNNPDKIVPRGRITCDE